MSGSRSRNGAMACCHETESLMTVVQVSSGLNAHIILRADVGQTRCPTPDSSRRRITLSDVLSDDPNQ
jgi:hypothetical protein